MLYFVYCEDNPGNSDVRLSKREAHQRYMSMHDNHIFLGGPTMDQSGGKADGTALVVNFPSMGSVHEFLNGDPYYNAGLFASRIVKLMQPVRIAPEVLEQSQEQIPRDYE